ncbi:CoA-transferase family III [Macrolepiota fuliginosa MF-IS2]|uniref:CoA-transferase family III n=1 Tax=Macrolepiota fuliginosa MF-IS2 TaxID=1400762 RepID=A0A9P5WXM8_9AGAR|nr:CoA-transferase family III [Macrolepiota fuliginosa MF-IS2]
MFAMGPSCPSQPSLTLLSTPCLKVLTSLSPAFFCTLAHSSCSYTFVLALLATITNDYKELPLASVCVLKLGQLIAGPFAGQLLGQFGAEVIKVEPPKVGYLLHVWRELDVDGKSPWFHSIARNKKSVVFDLRKLEGREYTIQLGVHGPNRPLAPHPGYALVCEAESRFQYINSFPNAQSGGLSGPVLALLQQQNKLKNNLGATGSTVDVSIVESMLNLMEGIIPEFNHKGKMRGPSGSSVTGIMLTNACPYLPSPHAPETPCYIVIGVNGDMIYKRLMDTISHSNLTGLEYLQNHHHVKKQAEIEGAISEWTSQHSAEEVIEMMNRAGVPVGQVVTVKEVVENEQVQAQGAVQEVHVQGSNGDSWNIKMQWTFLLADGVDSKPMWAGPNLGFHTNEVLRNNLGLSIDVVSNLRADGIIG